MIIGVALGGVFALMISAILIWYLCFKRRRVMATTMVPSEAASETPEKSELDANNTMKNELESNDPMRRVPELLGDPRIFSELEGCQKNVSELEGQHHMGFKAEFVSLIVSELPAREPVGVELLAQEEPKK